jgi:hypothetical protein
VEPRLISLEEYADGGYYHRCLAFNRSENAADELTAAIADIAKHVGRLG